MKPVITLAVHLTLLSLGLGADAVSLTNSETVLRERLFQRFLAEMGRSGITTNRDQSFTNGMRLVFDGYVIHPSFGLRWDEVPAPTLTNAGAMASVDTFIATNGWNMHTGALGRFTFVKNMKPIRGLPWKEIQKREFGAVTHNGILYVVLKGWHYNDSGVAYNPKTNAFAESIAGFKPLRDHWYVWAQPEDPITLSQEYEGAKR